MKQLEVYFNDIKAGILSEQNPETGYSFQYDEEYLNSAMPPISASMPNQLAPYSSENLFPFSQICFLREPTVALYAAS